MLCIKTAQHKTYLDIIDNYLIASNTDLTGTITGVSKAMCEISGYAEDELVGQKHNIIRHPDMPSSLFKELWETISSGKVWENDIKNKKKNGDEYWVKTRISPILDESNKTIGYASIRIDITDKKRIEELSLTDELTKLCNRRYFNDIFPKEILRAIRESKEIGFAIFDIDNFKLYNDNYGHQAGDMALQKLSDTVMKHLHRASDYCFRLGGEEFGILIYDINIDKFRTLLENIRKAIFNLQINHKYNNKFNFITASFGATTFKCNCDISIKTIYKFTDELLYFAKKDGRNKIKLESFDSINNITKNIGFNGNYKEPIPSEITYVKALEADVEIKNKELQQKLSELKSYKDAMDENSIVTISDPNGIIKYANNKFYEVTGFTKDEIIGKPHNIIRHPDTSKEVFKKLWETIQAKKIWKGKVKNRKKDGGYYIVQSAIVPILDENGEIYEYIGTRYEITELYKKNEEISKLARTDSLTGFSNRFKLNESLNSINEGSIALIDINNFHEINDFYGEKVGDKVICIFANILKEKLNNQYELFHLQGDEFIILNKQNSKEEFIFSMKYLNTYFNDKTIVFDEKIFYLTTTISLSFDEPQLLLSTVNLAHTYAKNNKLLFNIYSYETSLEKEYANNFKWASKIKKAIEDDRITVFFQPIIDTETKNIMKYEALVRLIDEDNNIISPYYFLNIAKKSNYYPKITQIVIEKTITQLSKNNISVTINLTIEDIINKHTKKFIFNKLKSCNNCKNITFELVESEGIENFDEVNDFIKKIKSYGCNLAIDDFGTGYSNFEYLLKLNADIIKIDGSLIKELDTNKDRYDIVKSIVDFAKVKNIKLVAEFVSSKEIYDKIKLLNIDYCQGYYFGEPKPTI